jgi:hypothetical protein
VLFPHGSAAGFGPYETAISRRALFASTGNTFISWMIRLFCVWERSRRIVQIAIRTLGWRLCESTHLFGKIQGFLKDPSIRNDLNTHHG